MSYVSATGTAPQRTSGSILPFEVYFEYIGVGGMNSAGLLLLSLSLADQPAIGLSRTSVGLGESVSRWGQRCSFSFSHSLTVVLHVTNLLQIKALIAKVYQITII
jgi:hypothetical protein